MTTRKKPKSKEIVQAQQASANLGTSSAEPSPGANARGAEERLVVTLAEETLQVDKAWVEAGTIELRKTVETHTETVPVDLTHEEVSIERVPVNRILAHGEEAGPRQEGDFLIIPVIEEELVVTKRRVVREEVRIRKTQMVTQQQVSERVKREDLTVHTLGDLQVVEEKSPKQAKNS